MKRLISILLVITLVAAFAACGKKTENEENSSKAEDVVVGIDRDEDASTEDKTENKDENASADKPEATTENDKSNPESAVDSSDANSSKPGGSNASASQQTSRPSTNSSSSQPVKDPVQNSTVQIPATSTPSQKPTEQKPADVNPPQQSTEQKPAPEASVPSTPSASASLGNTLLADFKSKAAGTGTEELANALLSNPAILFKGGVMPCENKVISGFTEEITGFKSAACFQPMMSSIAFIGYVFELESEAQVSAFIANLRAKANPSWNLCVTADETITGSVGNKVFFVMSPIEMN